MIRVMLIDDHPVVRAGLKSILESFENLEVVAEGSDGGAALEHHRPEDIDVVVMDIQMPGIDGLKAVQEMQKEVQPPPVLMLTTYDNQADIMVAIRAGAQGYLLKDAPENELHQAVVNASQGKRTLSPAIAEALMERVSAPEQSLSARELEILRVLATGATNKDLAARFFISEATVKTHLNHIYTKLEVENRTAAIREARSRRLV